MCLINFLYKVHPHYPLILIANRDEAYDRPTLAAHFWDDNPSILGGRDLLKMGTWLGIHKDGRIAALTNYRDPILKKGNKKSRGEITHNFLTSTLSPKAYLKELNIEYDLYDGFNVIVGTIDDLYYYNNIEQKIIPLKKGIYGLSNHFLNSPWPKVMQGKKQLYQYAMNEHVVNLKQLAEIHKDKEIAPDHTLPHTGVGIELERILSPLFIQSEDYGTRAITALAITMTMTGQVEFLEQTYNSGQFKDEKHFSFSLNHY